MPDFHLTTDKEALMIEASFATDPNTPLSQICKMKVAIFANILQHSNTDKIYD